MTNRIGGSGEIGEQKRSGFTLIELMIVITLIGILASVVVSRLLTGLLFNVTPYDPITLGVVALILGSVGLGASWVPALRASSVEPVEALRHD